MSGPAALFPRRLLALLATLLLAACTVAVDEGPGPRPGPQPQYCTREYNPVCAQSYGERRTFANGCLANRAGFDIVRPGECRRESRPPEEPRFCTREYRPVCARQGRTLKTFGNACEADAAGFRVIDNGPC